MGGMKDYAFSLKMRDTIVKMVEEVVDRVRPADRYGVVTSIDTVNRRANVTLNGDPTSVTVSMGAVQPAEIGQQVRVGGSSGDKFIKDVLSGASALRGGMTDELQSLSRRVQTRMTSTGILKVDSSFNVSWTKPIIAQGLGTSQTSFPAGYIEIDNPVGYTVTNKALTSNVATLTTSANHSMRIGDNITVTGVDATFNGAFVVTSTTSTTVSYAKLASNVISVASGGVVSCTIRGHGSATDMQVPVSGLINLGVWESLYYELRYGWGGGTTPGVNGVVSVTNKSLTSNVVTLTVTAPHYFVPTDQIKVAISDAVFDGVFTVTGVTPTTVTYAKTNANVASVATTGYAKPDGSQTLFGNFHKVNYFSDFVVPSNWVQIVSRNSWDLDMVFWWNGQSDTGWIAVTFQNSWTDYGSGHATCAYRKFNGRVHIKGLVQNGTVGAVPIFTLPVGFRPLEIQIFSGICQQFVVTTGAASTGTAHTHTVTKTNAAGRVDVNFDGTVTTPDTQNGNGFFSLSPISFIAEQ